MKGKSIFLFFANKFLTSFHKSKHNTQTFLIFYNVFLCFKTCNTLSTNHGIKSLERDHLFNLLAEYPKDVNTLINAYRKQNHGTSKNKRTKSNEQGGRSNKQPQKLMSKEQKVTSDEQKFNFHGTSALFHAAICKTQKK